MKERSTRQLAAVLEAVRASHDHPTAQEVLRRVRRWLPRISRGTVYRNLKKLDRHCHVRAVRLHGQPTRYDAIVGDHDHFVCDRCRRVIDLPQVVARPRDVAALKCHGYVVRSRATVFSGVCPRCETPRS